MEVAMADWWIKSDVMAKHRLIRNVLLLIPGIAAYILIDILFLKKYPGLELVMRITVAYLIAVVVMICNSVLQMLLNAYAHKGAHRNIPMHGLVQGVQIILYFAC